MVFDGLNNFLISSNGQIFIIVAQLQLRVLLPTVRERLYF
jgi:hypothetical protein